MERRSFLGIVAASTAGAANDRIRAGLIGTGSRGQLLVGEFKQAGAEIAALCDVYKPNLQEGVKRAPEAKTYDDYRRMLDDKSLDAIIIATPDHWHCPMAIDAVAAGKDVYLEKPMAHNIVEGFRLVDAVRRTRRVLQVGSQRRSSELFFEAKRLMDSGATGEVQLVNSWWTNTTPKVLPARSLEGKLDWRRWLGPAPQREFDPRRFFEWKWFADYSGGYFTGQAAHIVDAINWLMNSAYPLAVTAAGRLDQEGAEVPETATMTIEYPRYLAIFTLGYKAMRYPSFCDQLKKFHGSKAELEVGRETYALFPQGSITRDRKPAVEKTMPGSFNASTQSHVRNFLDCMRTRRDPNATVEMGQMTSVALCMAIEALTKGRRVQFDAGAQTTI